MKKVNEDWISCCNLPPHGLENNLASSGNIPDFISCFGSVPSILDLRYLNSLFCFCYYSEKMDDGEENVPPLASPYFQHYSSTYLRFPCRTG